MAIEFVNLPITNCDVPYVSVCLPEGIISLTIIINYSPSINHYFHHDNPSSHVDLDMV